KWNRAKADNQFVTGIHGGLYQVHQPGLSLVLLPGYVLDRYLLVADTTGDGWFPAAFPMTTAMMVVTYAACAVPLFQLLRSGLGSELLAVLWAALGMMTLPMAAFPFQFYPELPPLFVILVLTRYVWFEPDSSGAAAILTGAMAGCLPWFH